MIGAIRAKVAAAKSVETILLEQIPILGTFEH